jgi:hypothetical protein
MDGGGRSKGVATRNRQYSRRRYGIIRRNPESKSFLKFHMAYLVGNATREASRITRYRTPVTEFSQENVLLSLLAALRSDDDDPRIDTARVLSVRSKSGWKSKSLACFCTW